MDTQAWIAVVANVGAIAAMYGALMKQLKYIEKRQEEQFVLLETKADKDDITRVEGRINRESSRIDDLIRLSTNRVRQ